MGAGESSLLAVEEREACFRRGPSLSAELYERHKSGEAIPGLLTQVPDCLTQKVCLYAAVDLSFNLVASLPLSLPLTLPHLVSLNLSHNRLESLPHSMFGFLHLRDLSVAHNQLSCLPPGLNLCTSLRRLDVSYNKLERLPSSLDQLTQLEKLNVSNNQLSHLPLSLGGLPKLCVVLADNQTPPLAPHPEPLVEHLRSCFAAATQANKETCVRGQANIFPRVRGSVFDSRVLNSGSAQSLFHGMQAQAVQTGNRLLTPLIPPLGATTMDAERLSDAIIGMLYGAVLGDALGQLTVCLTPRQAAFYYNRDHLGFSLGLVDSVRARVVAGDPSPVSHLVLTTLDSVTAWGGVVDELEYGARLRDWYHNWAHSIHSPVLHQLLDSQESSQEEKEVLTPDLLVEGEPDSLWCMDGVTDSYCLPPVIGCVLAGWSNTSEAVADAVRLCRATHQSARATSAVSRLATLLSRLLQGQTLEQVLKEDDLLSKEHLKLVEKSDVIVKANNNNVSPTIEEGKKVQAHLNNMEDNLSTSVQPIVSDKESLTRDYCHGASLDLGQPTPTHSSSSLSMGGVMANSCPLDCLATVVEVAKDYSQGGFKAALTETVMRGGQAQVTGAVAGAVTGLLGGYKNLPQDWLEVLQPPIRTAINKRCNHLLDLMGVP